MGRALTHPDQTDLITVRMRSRPWFATLLALATAGFGSAATAAPAPTSPTAARPNIVWVVSEDNNPWLGCYGDPLARTPNLDRLAATGILYRHAHAAAPVCAPSRSSIITGRYAPRLGTQHMRSLVPLPAGLRFFPAYLREAGYYCTNRAKTDYNAETPPGTWDENGNRAHWRNRAPGQPFFAVFNFGSSHESNLHERRPLQTDPAKVRVPAYLPDTPEVRADIAQYHDCLATMDTQVGTLLAELADAGLAEDTIVFYYADNGGVLPRSKRFLYHNGTHVPLIIAFPQKWAHLAPAGPGTASDEMVTLLDLPATVLSLAGIAPPAGFDGRVLAGPGKQPAPRFVHAFRDRMDEGYDLGRAVIGPRYRYVRNYRPELPAGQHLDYLWRMASTRDWERLFRAGALEPIQEAFFLPRPAEMLFDTVADPDCVRNLVGEPRYADLLAEMRGANREHLLATRDLGFLPEAMMRAGAGPQPPAVAYARDDTYPLARILDVLDLLQLPPALPRDAWDAARRDDHPALRYWAAVSAARSPELAAELESLLDDSDPSVRLGAAFSRLRRQDLARAWVVLGNSLRADRPAAERLTAIHALSLLGPPPPEIRSILETEAAPADPLYANFYRRHADRLLGVAAAGGASKD